MQDVYKKKLQQAAGIKEMRYKSVRKIFYAYNSK